MKFFLGFLLLLFFVSCAKKSELSAAFHCEVADFSNVEEVKDAKNKFSIKIPKSWKTNLYYDEIQSSIFTADTTKQLTQTVLIDITHIAKAVNFDDAFQLQQEQEQLSKNLIKTKTKELILFNKPSLYSVYKGKKGKFDYQNCLTFVQLSAKDFLQINIEIYGDSLVNERLCKAIKLVDDIKIDPKND